MSQMFTSFNQKYPLLLAFIILSLPITLSANPFSSTSMSPTQELNELAMEGIGEIKTTRVNHKWKYVAFNRTYVNPVVVAGGPSYYGGDPTTVRIKNITPEGFYIRLDEWACQDEWHVLETVPYMVVEAGVYKLSNGKMLMAGKADNVNHRWTTVRFPQKFNRVRPIIFASVSTVRGGHSVVVRINHNRRNKVTAEEFSVKLQEDRTSDKWHTKEELCWIAVESGLSRTGNSYQFGRTRRIVDHKWKNVRLTRGLGEKPIFLSSLITFHGGHTSNVRFDHKNQSGRNVRVFIDEENCTGEGTRHPHREKVGYAAFKAAGPIYGEKVDEAPSSPCGSGFLTQEIWYNLDAEYDVSSIPVNVAPDETRTLTNFSITPDLEDYYGTRVRGYICPPVSGIYKLKIASDDNGELWLSTDDKAENKYKIAFVKGWTYPGEYNKYPEQISAGIYLEAGKTYYIEALMKETAAEDNLSVAWELPNGQEEAPIDGKHLSPYVESAASMASSFVRLSAPGATEADVRMFPNPAHSYFSVTVGGAVVNSLNVNILDMSGRSIWNRRDVRPGEEINIANLPTGMYVVRVNGADIDRNFRLIKN
ncbi:MAG: PA14 domain-containing protein [Bacteroidota bacterium]